MSDRDSSEDAEVQALEAENRAKQHPRAERARRRAQIRLQRVAASEQGSDVGTDTPNRHWTPITTVSQRPGSSEATSSDEVCPTQAHRNTPLEHNTLERHVQEASYGHDKPSPVQEDISAHDEDAASSMEEDVAASAGVVSPIGKNEDEDLANDAASSLASEDEASIRDSISFSSFSSNSSVAASTHSAANSGAVKKRMLNAAYAKMQTLVSVISDKVLELHSPHTFAKMADLGAHLGTPTCKYFMEALNGLQIAIKKTTSSPLKQSYRLLIWFLTILLVIFLGCEGFIYFVGSQRSGLDLASSLVCKILGPRMACRVLVCRMPRADRLFPSLCRTMDESAAIARTLQETYVLFANMVGLSTVMHRIPAHLTNHRQSLGFQIERFKVIQDDLATPSDAKVQLLQDQEYIYNTLLLTPDYLMRFYGHINGAASVVLFETSVITDDVAQILSCNSTDLVDQNYYKAQKAVNKRCLDHVAAWKAKMQFLVISSETINEELIRLEARVNVFRSNLQTVRKQTEDRRLKIIWNWSYHTRFSHWLSKFCLMSWLEVAVPETKDIEAYDQALESLDDLLFAIQKLRRLFTSLWSHTTQINYGLEQLVFKLSAQNFRFRPGHEGLVHLQSFLKELHRGGVRLAIKHNDGKMIEMDEATTDDGRVD